MTGWNLSIPEGINQAVQIYQRLLSVRHLWGDKLTENTGGVFQIPAPHGELNWLWIFQFFSPDPLIDPVI